MSNVLDPLVHLPPCSGPELQDLIAGIVPARIKADAADALELLNAEDAAALVELMKLRTRRDRETAKLKRENTQLKKGRAA